MAWTAEQVRDGRIALLKLSEPQGVMESVS